MNQVSYSESDKMPRTARGRRTRAKLLDAAEVEFGERGFSEASIGGITRRAGCAFGTFYIYFESKEEVFRALVTHMGHLTRTWIAERVAEAPDRITAEIQGLEAFIEFVRQHKNLYRIVMEAQFVAEDAYSKYYSDFADAYAANLQAAADAGEIRPGDYEEIAWALIGMSVFVGMRYAAWDESEAPAEVAEKVGGLIRWGLTTSKD